MERVDFMAIRYGKIGPEPNLVEEIGPCDRNKFNGTLKELKTFWLSGNCVVKNFQTIISQITKD
jgi:hypothetical protein